MYSIKIEYSVDLHSQIDATMEVVDADDGLPWAVLSTKGGHVSAFLQLSGYESIEEAKIDVGQVLIDARELIGDLRDRERSLPESRIVTI